MLILVLTLAFLFVVLLSSAAAFVSFVCAITYYYRVSAHLRRNEPQRLAELMNDPRAWWNPMRIVLAVLREAANGDDQRVRSYADRARSWGRHAALAWAAAIISGLILGLLNLGQ